MKKKTHIFWYIMILFFLVKSFFAKDLFHLINTWGGVFISYFGYIIDILNAKQVVNIYLDINDHSKNE